MSIANDKGYVVVRWREKDENGKWHQRSHGKFGRWNDPVAMQKAAEFNRTVNPENDSPESLRLVDIVMAYLREHPNLKEGSRDDIRYRFNGSILPVLGFDVRVSQLSKTIMANFESTRLSQLRWKGRRNGKEGTVRPSNVAKDTSVLKYVLNWAAEDGIIPFNPIASFKGIKENREVIDPPNPDEIAEMLKFAPKHIRRIIILGLAIGARVGRSELFKLGWENIDFTTRQVNIRSAEKGGPVKRSVPVEDETIWKEFAVWKAEDKRLFGPVVHYNGKPIRYPHKAWNTMLRKAGITRHLTPYTLRHRFCTNLLEAGVDPRTGADLAGHANPVTFLRTYCHSGTPQKRAAMAKLPPLPGLERSTSTPPEPIPNTGSDVRKETPANPRQLRVIK